MDLVIRVDGRFVRLSPSNRVEFRDAGGPLVKLRYKDGFYVRDEAVGVEMRDVSRAWNDRRAKWEA